MDAESGEIELNELKRQAMCYYGSEGNGSGVPEKMEEILNTMFYDNPPDVYGHLVRSFCLFSESKRFIKALCNFSVTGLKCI